MKPSFIIITALTLISCANKPTDNSQSETTDSVQIVVEPIKDPMRVGEIPLPEGFERVPIEDTTSFAYFLRNLPLKPIGTPVYTYDGYEYWTTDYAYAVIDGYDPGNEDLQLCADAIIRIRAEWLWRNKRYDEIVFHFTNGDLCEYKRFAEGESFTIKNNKIVWYKDSKKHDRDYSYEYFLAYLNWVFRYAGTISLERELSPVDIHDIQIGDVFIKGGSPGHAIIVVDVANDVKWHKGDKVFLVAESYMPAQDIHILKNMNNYREKTSPWHIMYDVIRNGEDDYNFSTFSFGPKNLKRFSQLISNNF